MPRYTNQERKGIIMLLIVGLLVLIGPQLYLQYLSKHQEPLVIGTIPFDTISNSLPDQNEDNTWNNWTDWNEKEDDEINPYKVKERFPFNPNTITYDSLLRLGFTVASAKTLIKSRDSGYKFRSKSDLLKMYNIDQNLIESLSSLINFDIPSKDRILKLYPEKIVESIEINSADSSQWEQLPNIGSGTIYKIYKHKNALGGFISINQLIEDKIVHDTTFAVISPYLTVDKTKIKKININKAAYRELIKHPYFDTKTINAVVKYREQNGNFKDPKDIRKIISLSKATGEKILPYLGLE